MMCHDLRELPCRVLCDIFVFFNLSDIPLLRKDERKSTDIFASTISAGVAATDAILQERLTPAATSFACAPGGGRNWRFFSQFDALEAMGRRVGATAGL
jgi:hypothetical protein